MSASLSIQTGPYEAQAPVRVDRTNMPHLALNPVIELPECYIETMGSRPGFFKKILRNSPAMIMGAGAGAFIRWAGHALLTKFILAGSMMVMPAYAAPVVAGVTASLALGLVAGVATNLIRSAFNKYILENPIEDQWISKSVKRGLLWGSLGGLGGGLFAHWDAVTDATNHHLLPYVEQKIEGIGNVLSKGLSTIKNFFRPAVVQEAAHIDNKIETASHMASTAKSIWSRGWSNAKSWFSSVTQPRIAGTGELYVPEKPDAGHHLTGNVKLKPEIKALYESDLSGFELKQELARVQDEIFKTKQLAKIDLHNAPAPHEAVQSTVEAMPSFNVPKYLTAYMDQSFFETMPTKVQERLATLYNGNLSPSNEMAALSDTAYFLLNKTFKSTQDVPQDVREMVTYMYRKALAIAKDNGELNSQNGKLIAGNLSYLYRQGIGVAKDMTKATYLAILGNGSKVAQQSLAVIKEQAPEIYTRAMSKYAPLLARNTLG